MESSLALAFYASIALAILILLLAGLFSKSEGALVSWGVVASVLVLVQILILRHKTAYVTPWSRLPEARLLRLDAAISVLLLAGYFLVVIVKTTRARSRSSRNQSRSSTEEPVRQFAGSPPRQVPLIVPTIFLLLIAISVLAVKWAYPESFFLLLAFPTGLLTYLPRPPSIRHEPTELFLTVLMIVSPYALYLILLAAMFRVRKWNTFGIVCFILACVLLLNMAGCGRILEDLSRIQ
jgi:hypothetical protein